jgi:MFS family permease
VIGVSFRQAIIPGRLMGRVSSAFRLYALGAMAIGAVIGGFLARNFGLLTPYWLSALAMLAIGIALFPAVNNRTMADARRAALHAEHPEQAPGTSLPSSRPACSAPALAGRGVERMPGQAQHCAGHDLDDARTHIRRQ